MAANLFNQEMHMFKTVFSKLAVVGSSALVGSSNFTYPGLTGNVELNVQLRREVEELQQWYEDHWNDAEDVTAEILQVMERQIRHYLPFEVYALSLIHISEPTRPY